MLARVRGEARATDGSERRELPTTLVVRESVAAPAGPA